MENQPENVEKVSCSFCRQENDGESQFCIYCGKSLKKHRITWSSNRYIVAGTALILVGLFALFWMHNLESKEVGKVNGEIIGKEEFSKRIERAKKFYEYRYGPDVFQGETGKENLNRVKADTLDQMINEKIILQEAKSAGYTTAPEEEIGKQLEAIKKNNNLSDTDLTRIFGGSIEDFKADLRKGWVISDFMEKAVLKGNEADKNQLVSDWFAKAKAKSRIETYLKLEPVSTATASCCSTGAGGCGGSGRAQPLNPKIEKEAKAKGLEYYENKTHKKGADARVTNFGCHIQVDIIEDGKVVVSLTYREGEVQEI